MDYRAVPATNKAFLAVARAKALAVDTPETALHPAIVPQPNDIKVRKTRVGAFSTTDLDELLTNLGVTTLILVGVRTSGVVLSTVREAADRDYRPVLLSDCIADSDGIVHDVLMERVFPRQADIASSAELDQLFAKATTAP
jgi:nicotinamidase-related amidase